MKKALLFSLFLIGVFGDELKSVSVTEGESVTLQTGVTELQKGDGIEWKFNGTRIAKISISSKGLSVSISADEEFRGRLQLDNQTGDLTITNIKTTDSGTYKLKITSTTTSEKIFIVNGVASADKDPVKSVAVQQGDSVTLHTKIQRDDVIRWMFGRQNSLIGEINRKTGNVSTHGGPEGEFRDRLQMDYLTGSLTIRNIGTEHSGLYEVDISRGGYTIHKSFSVTVRDGLKPVSVSEGESVTLNTDLTAIQTDDVILWMFRDTHIAEINKADQQFHISDVPDGRFRGRLKLDNQTGSLTITNIRTTDFGLYEVTISHSRFTIHKRIIVTVTDAVKSVSVSEGESVTLNTDLTAIQTDDVILWMFRDTHIAKINKADQQFHISDVPDGRFRGRLKLDNQTGSLTITNTRTTDSGLYEVTISHSRFTIHKRIIVTVTDSGSGLSVGTVVGIIVAALLGFAPLAAAVIYYRRQIYKLQRQIQERPAGTESVPLNHHEETLPGTGESEDLKL